MKLKYLIYLIIAAAIPAIADTPAYLDVTQPIDKRVEDALSRMTLKEKIGIIHAQSKFCSPGVSRLGIPELWTTDGPHGIRPEVLWDEWEQAGWSNDSCVAFPALTCLAATWNRDMSALYGKSIGEEARYRKKSVILGPGVNIYRTPLNGRYFEYMGEDPYLAGEMAVPYVKGVQSNGVAACVKHFALNNQELNRHTTNVIVDDRTLYEIYLPAFKKAVTDGGAWSIMGTYNYYKDQHLCHNQYLINDILKGEWGFDGAVISDWGGTHNTAEAITNGLDLEFGSWTNGLSNGRSNAYDNYYLANPYLNLISEGKVGTKELDDKVRRVLKLIFRTEMNRNRPFGSLCSDNHYAAAHVRGEYPGVKRPDEDIWDERYGEGIFVGYRWHDTKKIAPLFAFGHGLSYTTFDFGKVMADRNSISGNERITFTVPVTNTGDIAGAEVVQLYISDPECSVERPAKELKGFAKVFLQPGETRNVSFEIGKDDLCYFNADNHEWTVEPGKFRALVGAASDDIRTTATFNYD